MESSVEHAGVWQATVYLEEHDHMTAARVQLNTGDNELVGHGQARCHPGDRDVPEIGKELATARALADLAHKLFDSTVEDIAAMTQETPVIRT